jgi:hypothetical protein
VGLYLIKRAADEYVAAERADVKAAKFEALKLLLRYGWRDVFKEHLTPDGTRFKSLNELQRLCPVCELH